MRQKISCDQVAWLLDIADRYIPYDKYPSISRQREMKKYGMLYEIMEIANLEFQDDYALSNATPQDVNINKLTSMSDEIQND
jgi:hypothetical protein